jgi:hypothetical protein
MSQNHDSAHSGTEHLEKRVGIMILNNKRIPGSFLIMH